MSETEEARLECYTEAIADAESESVIPTFEELASAAIAVADEEQAALRAEVERLRTEMRQHLDGGQLLLDRAQDASKRLLAEVERLTRECLDREATETDARERLRQAEERLDKVKAMHRLASDGQHCFTCVMPWHWPCPTASELQ